MLAGQASINHHHLLAAGKKSGLQGKNLEVAGGFGLTHAVTEKDASRPYYVKGFFYDE